MIGCESGAVFADRSSQGYWWDLQSPDFNRSVFQRHQYLWECVAVLPAKLCVGMHSRVWRSHDVSLGAAELCTMEDTSAARLGGKHSLVQTSNIPDNTFVCIYHQLGPCALIIYTTVTVSTILHCTNISNILISIEYFQHFVFWCLHKTSNISFYTFSCNPVLSDCGREDIFSCNSAQANTMNG